VQGQSVLGKQTKAKQAALDALIEALDPEQDADGVTKKKLTE
jgi:hypothetical protein